MKSEPDVYSIDHLARDHQEPWEGVRNYQARNFMREMAEGDLVIFYHSSANPPGAAGVCRVCREAYPDDTQFNKKSKYYDPKSKPEAPRWMLVDVKFVAKLKAVIPLALLKANPKLKDMKLVQKGMRLSVQPVATKEWKEVMKMAGR